MYRKITKTLMEWKDNFKKPLMLIGARQTGKTYIISEFCNQNFENYLYINLEKEENIQKIFQETIDPKEIIEQIKIIKNIRFNIEDTIIFLDEIQVSEEAISSLKYFCESNLPYKIICAGSLLGVKINRFKKSFPVGKVNIKYLYPMDFEEFLIALDKKMLLEEIRKCFDNNRMMNEALHNLALTYYRYYLICGGMPESVKNFVNVNCDIVKYDSSIKKDIIDAYLKDMKKYVINLNEALKIEKVYNSIPKQISN